MLVPNEEHDNVLYFPPHFTLTRDRSIPAKECPEQQRTVIAFAAAAACGGGKDREAGSGCFRCRPSSQTEKIRKSKAGNSNNLLV